MPEPATTSLWGVFETEFAGPRDGNPHHDVTLDVVFACDGREVVVPGYHDGDGTYRVRHMPDRLGEWRYVTRCNRAELDGLRGDFFCGPAGPGAHGPVAVRDRFHFAHADGTRYFPFGTTCYAWTHQPLAMQQQTLATLAGAGFNKLRMGVFPKHYIYSENEPLHRMFELGPDGREDFDRPNHAAFRHLERQVAALMQIGIEADIILFHPYDRWGYCAMSEAQDLAYLRHVVARLCGYRNVWWSLANEYDFLLDVKPLPVWDRFCQRIREWDPYGHPMSIHNGEVSMKYDHRKDWITHVSVQDWDVKRTAEWRQEWGKPLVNDEMEYEGDIPRPWGNISARELVHRFWLTVVRGGYGGHGETYLQDDDLLWWAKGGMLRGESAPRIAFLRALVEEDVETGLTPLSEDGRWEFNRVSGARDGDYRLLYFGEHQPAHWAVGLPMDDGDYEIDLIDTWEMTVTRIGKAPLPLSPALRQRGGAMAGGSPEAAFGVRLPGKPWQAIRVRRGRVSDVVAKPIANSS
ncbi:DUF5060 domain-containing protein [Lichenicoccus roseus]|uniref:DUF5060 domain-containing protein n=1 Tax=Lichenicoccus roseus TaxID=2683649 RepID=A0A5R9J5K4_9PROT|nr:DUF5060 domain-containing protein [Lichenicoccus roseus]TLU72239.1 DUF5060 domain-containing protein [Lichenicoccus roseus]